MSFYLIILNYHVTINLLNNSSNLFTWIIIEVIISLTGSGIGRDMVVKVVVVVYNDNMEVTT